MLRGWKVDLRFATVGDASVLDVCGDDWAPECVICDFRLPGTMDGITLLDFLLEKFPGAIGIVQTGEQALSVQTLAQDAGYLVLFKPVDLNVLASTLSAGLNQPAARNAA